MKKICSNCQYCDMIVGRCHFNPPTFIDGIFQFPVVKMNSWCGKFIEKDSENE